MKNDKNIKEINDKKLIIKRIWNNKKNDIKKNDIKNKKNDIKNKNENENENINENINIKNIIRLLRTIIKRLFA